jgi:uncharacterized protein (DUF1778 family)
MRVQGASPRAGRRRIGLSPRDDMPWNTCGRCAYTPTMVAKAETRDERLHLRLSPTDDGLIRAAAEAAHLSITEFVVQAARASAAETLADRTHVLLDAKTWDALDRRVSRKGRRNPKTAELFKRPSPFQR